LPQAELAGKTATFYLFRFPEIWFPVLRAPINCDASRNPFHARRKIPLHARGNTTAKINPSKFNLAGRGFFIYKFKPRQT
jgi:hypothetical protein